MPRYAIEVKTELKRLWIIKASDMDEAERMAKEATIQLIQEGGASELEEILDGCEVETTSESYPTIERSECIDD